MLLSAFRRVRRSLLAFFEGRRRKEEEPSLKSEQFAQHSLRFLESKWGRVPTNLRSSVPVPSLQEDTTTPHTLSKAQSSPPAPSHRYNIIRTYITISSLLKRERKRASELLVLLLIIIKYKNFSLFCLCST